MEERYIVDNQGQYIGVVLDMETYRQLVEAAEELADIKSYLEAKQALAAGEEVLPLDQAVAEYERRHGVAMQLAS